MLKWAVFVSCIFATLVNAEVGKISRILGSNDTYILRQNEKIAGIVDASLEEGDEIVSQDSVVQIYLYPSTQLSLSKNTHIRITQNLIEESNEKDKAYSIIDYIKGLVRLQVTKAANQEIEQKVQANGVAFAVRGTEFEVSQDGEDVDLDVIEGEVEVSSPYVQTFVPEIVKANEGFKFNKRARQFERRKFRMKFKDYPRFASREEIRQKWREKKEERRLKKQERREAKKFRTRQQKNERKSKK